MTYALTCHDGLLSSELSASIAKIRADFAPWFEVATSLSKLGMRVLPVLKPDKTSNQRLLAAALSGRVLTSFQSTYVLIWPSSSRMGKGFSRVVTNGGVGLGWGATPNEQRDARAMAATMDHSDIRGLGTAFHLFLAGLPRSSRGDHHVDAHIKRPRIPLIVPAHRVADWVSG